MHTVQIPPKIDTEYSLIHYSCACMVHLTIILETASIIWVSRTIRDTVNESQKPERSQLLSISKHIYILPAIQILNINRSNFLSLYGTRCVGLWLMFIKTRKGQNLYHNIHCKRQLIADHWQPITASPLPYLRQLYSLSAWLLCWRHRGTDEC